MSPSKGLFNFKFVINMKMKNWLSKIDFTLTFRLVLGITMMVTGYIQNDYTSGSFGLLLLVYAIIAAKYKVGCGYNSCGYIPMNKSSK